MKDLEFNSDTESYKPIFGLTRQHKDDINTECIRKKLNKARRLKTVRIRNLISKGAFPLNLNTIKKQKRTTQKRPYSSYYGSNHNLDINYKAININDSVVDRHTWHEAVSNCRSFNHFEIENVECISSVSKKRSADDLASQLRKLHF